MKFIFSFLILMTLTISCGGDSSNSSGESNGVDSETRYKSLTNDKNSTDFMRGSYGQLRLSLLNDNHFTLYKKTQFGLEPILEEKWGVDQSSITLRGVGSGSYMESTVNDVEYDCILMEAASLSELIKDELKKSQNINQIQYLTFCKLRKK